MGEWNGEAQQVFSKIQIFSCANGQTTRDCCETNDVEWHENFSQWTEKQKKRQMSQKYESLDEQVE